MSRPPHAADAQTLPGVFMCFSSLSDGIGQIQEGKLGKTIKTCGIPNACNSAKFRGILPNFTVKMSRNSVYFIKILSSVGSQKTTSIFSGKGNLVTWASLREWQWDNLSL
jgi:hypothetical protein